MKKVLLFSLVASISAIFSFTELIDGTLFIARVLTIVFGLMFVITMSQMIHSYVKPND